MSKLNMDYILIIDEQHRWNTAMYSSLWCVEGNVGEKRLLAGLVEADHLPKNLMSSASVAEECPYVPWQVGRVWKLAVKSVMRKLPCA